MVSVNVGIPRVTEWHGRMVESGIWKEPVEGRVAVVGVNVDGDGQADPRVHGGPDKAVYTYAAEDYAWWSARLGRLLEPGTFGENLTTNGVDLNTLAIGSRVHAGSVLLETAGPRMPCFKLGMRMGEAAFVDEFEAAARFGAYFRIVSEGDVAAGDEIRVEARADLAPTVREIGVGFATPTPELLERVLAEPSAGDTLRAWAAQHTQRRDRLG